MLKSPRTRRWPPPRWGARRPGPPGTCASWWPSPPSTRGTARTPRGLPGAPWRFPRSRWPPGAEGGPTALAGAGSWQGGTRSSRPAPECRRPREGHRVAGPLELLGLKLTPHAPRRLCEDDPPRGRSGGTRLPVRALAGTTRRGVGRVTPSRAELRPNGVAMADCGRPGLAESPTGLRGPGAGDLGGVALGAVAQGAHGAVRSLALHDRPGGRRSAPAAGRSRLRSAGSARDQGSGPFRTCSPTPRPRGSRCGSTVPKCRYAARRRGSRAVTRSCRAR